MPPFEVLPTFETAWGVIDFEAEWPPVDDKAAMRLFHKLSEGADMFTRATPDAAYDPFGAS